MQAERIVAFYLWGQSVCVALWWGLLYFVPESVAWFHPRSWPRDALLSFWIADASALIVGSAVAGAAVFRRRSWAGIAVWIVAAVAWYPTLYCLGVSLRTDEAWLATALMVCLAGLSLAMATIHGHDRQRPAMIRVTPMTPAVAILWTVSQTVIFWGIFLWILPRGIVELEGRLGMPTFSPPLQSLVAMIGFLAASMLGLASGLTMATRGSGTPRPTATAANLVISGPYRYVRNPMANAGILQAIAVGWYLGSYGVIAYSLAGAILWHVAVRPIEEADLRARFGETYEAYRSDVRLWIPLRY